MSLLKTQINHNLSLEIYMPFKIGNKLGKGGVKPGAGGRMKWWKEECHRIIRTADGLKMMEDALNGKAVDTYVTKQGEIIKAPAKFKDVRDTVFDLSYSAYGKPAQEIQHTGADGEPLGIMILPSQDSGEAGSVR